jgi:hypothetical protein
VRPFTRRLAELSGGLLLLAFLLVLVAFVFVRGCGDGVEHCYLASGRNLENAVSKTEEDVELGNLLASVSLEMQHTNLLIAGGGRAPILGSGWTPLGETIVEIEGDYGRRGLRGTFTVSRSIVSNQQTGQETTEPARVLEGKLQSPVDFSSNPKTIVITYAGTLVESGRSFSCRVEYSVIDLIAR